MNFQRLWAMVVTSAVALGHFPLSAHARQEDRSFPIERGLDACTLGLRFIPGAAHADSYRALRAATVDADEVLRKWKEGCRAEGIRSHRVALAELVRLIKTIFIMNTIGLGPVHGARRWTGLAGIFPDECGIDGARRAA